MMFSCGAPTLCGAADRALDTVRFELPAPAARAAGGRGDDGRADCAERGGCGAREDRSHVDAAAAAADDEVLSRDLLEPWRLRAEEEQRCREEERAREARARCERDELVQREERAQREERSLPEVSSVCKAGTAATRTFERARSEAEVLRAASAEQAQLLVEEQLQAMSEEKRRAEERRASDRERKDAVAKFLSAQGFTGGVCGPRRAFLNLTYPLHCAARIGDARTVALLLQEGADAAQKDSLGRTAAHVAEKHNRGGSHAAVLQALAAAAHVSAASAAGGA